MGLRQILCAEARDALVFTSSTLINRVGAFLLLPLFLSRLSPGDYGILAVTAVVGAFQMLVTDRLPLVQSVDRQRLICHS